MDARIRPATDGDLPAILQLMSDSLGGALPRSEAFFRWKHIDNPFGRSLMLVAEDEQGLVGLRCFMRWRFRAGDRVVHAVRPVDTATHPRFRRRGLFTRLTRQLLGTLADEGVDLVFNTPNEKSRPGYLKMGWQSVGVVPLWARTGGFLQPWRRPVPEGGLVLAGVPDDRLQTERGGDYLGWRYGRAPGLSYQVVGDRRGGVVLRHRERNGRSECAVVEVCAPRRRDVPRVAALLGRAVAGTDSHYALAVASTDTREAAVLALAGFLPVGARGPHLVARAVEDSLPVPKVFSLAGWRVQAGDLEVF